MADCSDDHKAAPGRTRTPTMLATDRTHTLEPDDHASSSSDSSGSAHSERRGRSARSPRSREIKKAAEKKFRHRYLLLQQAYEQRLQALAAQVRHVVAELQADSTIEYLQQDPLTHEYAGARVAEIIDECFSGEREKYVKLVSDQIAWQTNDLREAQQRIRSLEKREKTVQGKWKHAQSEVQQLQRQLELRVRELGERARDIERLEEAARKTEDERDECRVALERARHSTTSLEALRREYEMFQVHTQNDREQERIVHENLKQQIEQLRDERQQADNSKLAVERDNQHLRQLLKSAEAKIDELANSLRQVQAEEYSTRLLRMEHELSQQRHTNEQLVKENEQLKKKYEEFGVQVELYMEEQSRERATAVKQSEERERKLIDDLASLRAQGNDAIKVKQNEMLRLADQVKFRQDLLVKAEQKISVLEERVSGLESQLSEEKLRSAKTISELDKEITQWTTAVEKEQERLKSAEAAHALSKQAYEERLASMQETMDQMHQHSAKERELEARMKWQNEFVANQEARIEAMKSKYDAALEAQQTELVRSRQVAMEAARSAAEKVEEVRALQLSQRVDDEDARRRRDEVREAERLRVETERTREAAHRKQMKELEEKDRRLKELEQQLADRERIHERRRAAEEAHAKAEKADRPSVVVLNVNGSDELDEQEEKVGAQAIAVVKRQKKASAAARMAPRTYEDNQEGHGHDDCIPVAQHKAELQAREAQVALEAEKRVQKEIQEFQERKERELRNAMVNVRKGIQKLETSLDTEKSEKKRIEEELFSERQGFVALKSELDDAREAKRTLAQRLEEANGHIGRLRDVVKEAQQKLKLNESLTESATRDKHQAETLYNALQEDMKKAHDTVKELREKEAHLQAELQETLSTQKDLREQVQTLQQEYTAKERQFHAVQQEQSELHAREIELVSDELSARIRNLESQLMKQNGEAKQLLEQVEGGAKSMEQLAADRLALERALDTSKTELTKQRKEFNDLARMHKNLSDSMNTRIRQEQQKHEQLEQELDTVRRSRDSIKAAKKRALELCHTLVQQLRKECQDLRKGAASEVKSAWKSAKKETQFYAKEVQGFLSRTIEKERSTWEDALRVERQEWRSRLEVKEQEMYAVLAGERVNGESKYGQLVDRLDAKSQELRELERVSTTQASRIGDLQLIIKRLEEENESRLLQQSQLVEQLSSSRVLTDREVEAKEQLRVSVARVADVTQIVLDFVRQVMTEFALDPRKVLNVLDCDPRHPEALQSDSLASDLSRVLELLQERMTAKELAAADLASRPLQNELNAARDALLPLSARATNDVDDSVAKHLPWYIVVVRSVKQQLEQLGQEANELRMAISAKANQSTEMKASLEKLQQAEAALLFEKDTLSHEMNLQLQMLQKRREGDLQQQQDDFDRKLDQLQRRQAAEHLKATEEYELALEQLKVALDIEKKAHSKLKQDAMVARVEHEKTQSELRDRAGKIEKELESVRDELAKWKRKAKLSASKSPGTPSRRPSVMFSSPFHQTDDDASEASFRSMFPVSRRPSSAMADLSNLMEQSLHDLRRDNEGMLASPMRQQQQLQPSPTPRLLQSPMRRVSASSRPSPLRIPMYPSPARKRTSLVPPPKLISTVTGTQNSHKPPTAPPPATEPGPAGESLA